MSAQSTSPQTSIPVQERLLWGLNDLVALLGLSRRMIERQIATGMIPRCDLRVGRRLFWRPETIRRWIENSK